VPELSATLLGITPPGQRTRWAADPIALPPTKNISAPARARYCSSTHADRQRYARPVRDLDRFESTAARVVGGVITLIALWELLSSLLLGLPADHPAAQHGVLHLASIVLPAAACASGVLGLLTIPATRPALWFTGVSLFATVAWWPLAGYINNH
jgi:hypothetical protein